MVGFLKMLLNANNSEGIREAMRMSYKKMAGTILHSVSEEKYFAGMFNALYSRYMVNNQSPPENMVLLELKPFLVYEDQERGLRALSEYIVYKELPMECNIENLKHEMEYFIKKIKYNENDKEEYLNMMVDFGVPWVNLIENLISSGVFIDKIYDGVWENEYFQIRSKNKKLRIIDKKDGELSIPNNAEIIIKDNKAVINYIENSLRTVVSIVVSDIVYGEIELIIYHGENVHAKEKLKMPLR